MRGDKTLALPCQRLHATRTHSRCMRSGQSA